MAGQLAVANIFIGAAIGAAVIWFLVAPAVAQSRADRMNDQMREYSEEIKSLEAQVSAQTRTLDNYRASGENAEDAAQQTQTTRDSYESLLTAQDQYDSPDYGDADVAETLLKVSRDSLGANAQAAYDELSAAVYPGACDTYFATGSEALNAEDYQGAVDALAKVVRMDEGYNSGQALFYLAQAYQESGDNDNAATYYQRVVEGYADSEYAAEAQTNLDEVSRAAQ